ncbi:unnamed protein product [Medioppia subpectinata]|uniref:Protein kinase domain-containing protein n=1 Tax=Medioppia subpectinata TaxID=1979941 RepID=A0A7R9LAY3_9ACAR|nr:unnamed protein product [Medioppia subpectinata]CAG2117323.1 unnamed protein product [Medioppia subpectinata]
MSIITNSSRYNYYDETFDSKSESTIGSGFSATVYRVKPRDKADGQTYAVKRITLSRLNEKQKSNAMKESEFLVKVSSEVAVKYIDSWLEGNSLLYIQMEACDQSLRHILEAKRQAFGRQSAEEPMKCHEWYLSCHIYRELLACVQCLHDMRPQLIHRDLKPENVLIQRQANGQWCLKLCDFGLSTLHNDAMEYYRSSQKDQKESHTQDVGDLRYIAHEVVTSRKYDTKADVYSLAIIGGELFDINVSAINLNNFPDDYLTRDNPLNAAVYEMHKLLDSMFVMKPSLRPNCGQVLDKYDNWSIAKTVVQKDSEVDITVDKLLSLENKFFCDFFLNKLHDN